jgi:hypothetical protein
MEEPIFFIDHSQMLSVDVLNNDPNQKYKHSFILKTVDRLWTFACANKVRPLLGLCELEIECDSKSFHSNFIRENFWSGSMSSRQ